MMESSTELSTDSSSHFVIKCENELCPCENNNSKCEEYKYELLDDNNDDKFEKSKYNCEEFTEEPIKKLSIWETILKESEEKYESLYKWHRDNRESESKEDSYDDNTCVKYLNNKIFPILLPIMEQMLIEACQLNALDNEKCQFNGLDYLAEHLWNKNPQHPERSENWIKLFDIPSFKHWLREYPRPTYPKSWQWTNEQAALYIQRCVRGWIVRKRDNVQELRQFWKALAIEKRGHED